ncbi:MAG: conjugative transfer signal peptidase TraF [Pseudonocardiaceae bacterium]
MLELQVIKSNKGRAAVFAKVAMTAFVLHGAALGVVYAAGFRINVTDSMPLGIWRVERGGPLVRGEPVWACPPSHPSVRFAAQVGYLKKGFCPGGVVPVLKPVVALPGDHIAVSSRGVAVNGHLIPATAPLPFSPGVIPKAVEGEGIVRPGQAWVVSTYNPRSYDSRYFGPVDIERIDGPARPVYVQDKRHD